MGETPSYAEVRQMREDDPRGGDFLSAKDFPNGADVEVVDVEVRQNKADAKYHPGEFQPYWRVNVKDGKQGALLRETKPMSDKLTELEIEDPTGHTFLLTTIPTNNGSKTWAIARAL